MTEGVFEEINNESKEEIDDILKLYEGEKGNLISILQKVQDYYHYLPSNVLVYLSEKLELPLAEIYSIATFYTQFKFEKTGKYMIVCCDGTACHVKGAPLLLNYFENELGIKPGETTKDLIFSLDSVACLGCCAISPVCVVNGQIHGDLTLRKVKRILKKLRKEVETNT